MNINYWYARGYHDGRSKHNFNFNLHKLLLKETYDAYKTGYNMGKEDRMHDRIFGEKGILAGLLGDNVNA